MTAGMIQLTIDGRPVTVPAGSTLREAALAAGIHTPTLCWHPHFPTGANCRACVVEVENSRVLVPACSRAAEDGMAVQTDSERVRQARRLVFELLLSQVDLTAAPECQAYAAHYGADAQRFALSAERQRPAAHGRRYGEPPAGAVRQIDLPPVADNPFFVRDYARCIACRRCTEACGTGIQHTFAISMVGRGAGAVVGVGGSERLPDSPCVFCGNCVEVCPTGALTGKHLHQARAAGWVEPAPPVTTTCSFCGVGCTLTVHHRGDRITHVSSPLTAPANRGNLCVKGRFGFNYVTHPGRLTEPLVRKGGKLAPATWDEALDLVARRLAAVRDRYGADAVAGFSSAKCTNEENYLMQKFMRTVIGTHNIDHCSRLCHASSVAGVSMAIGSTAMSNSIGELRHEIDCMLVTGSNTTENHPIIALEMKAAVARGAKLILVEPREIELARHATIWLRQRHGTDVAVFNGMAHVILRERLHHRAFLDARVETDRLAELRAALEPYSPERVAEIAGIDAGDLTRAARLYAKSPAAGIFWGMGISQHHCGTDNALALANLALLCGQIGRAGTGLNPLRGQNNVQGAGDMGCLPNVFPGYQPVTDEPVRRRFEQIWGLPLSRSKGLTATEATNAAHDGQVRAMYVMGENPLLTDPNLAHARAAFERLDFLVVQDIFLTETARQADVVLPAWSWAEKDGTFTNTERRVQRVRRILPPPGSARADWAILFALARRLGHDWRYDGPEAIFAEIRQANPDYAGITYDRIEQQGLQWPCPTTDHPGTRYLFADGFPRGRARLHPVHYIPPAEEPDADFPLVLTTGRVLYHWHGGTLSRASDLQEIYPAALVEVHPDDAAALGIAEGQRIRVTSRRGAIEAAAKITERSRPGAVFATFHFAEAAINLLTNDALDPYAKIPEFKVCAVRLERAAAPG